jgi:hypothetical protein
LLVGDPSEGNPKDSGRYFGKSRVKQDETAVNRIAARAGASDAVSCADRNG